MISKLLYVIRKEFLISIEIIEKLVRYRTRDNNIGYTMLEFKRGVEKRVITHKSVGIGIWYTYKNKEKMFGKLWL